MKKDILFPQVEGVSVAIVREGDAGEYSWNVFMINENKFDLKDITIRSKGYGPKEGDQQMTSTLRHHIQLLSSQSTLKIEPIDPAVFHLYNEYWISYYVNNQIFDKKFIFVPESIIEKNLVFIPQLELQGILHT
ncbi:hypothetical protein [Sporocytophaga myxococcoides]|uniref:hypothetical protein n=1 Tax=Sporocytophaga myxococcoides TaxID=153721 RepID=UPI000421CFAB|nr:hypothetical protein [Sporocytophaga myxococcoides]